MDRRDSLKLIKFDQTFYVLCLYCASWNVGQPLYNPTSLIVHHTLQCHQAIDKCIDTYMRYAELYLKVAPCDSHLNRIQILDNGGAWQSDTGMIKLQQVLLAQWILINYIGYSSCLGGEGSYFSHTWLVQYQYPKITMKHYSLNLMFHIFLLHPQFLCTWNIDYQSMSR